MATSHEQCDHYASEIQVTAGILDCVRNATRYATTVSPAPYINGSRIPLEIMVSVNLMRILDFSTDKILSLLVEYSFQWIDYNVDCGGCGHSLLVPADAIWTPLIGLNDPASVDTWRYKIKFDPLLTPLCGSGCGKAGLQVSAELSDIFSTVCGSMDVSNFPYDVQTCSLSISPFYTQDNVKLVVAPNSTVQINKYADSDVWTVVNASASAKASTHHVSIVLRRESYYYVVTILAPTTVLCSLLPFVFFVPSDEGVKVLFSVTLLLAFSVLQGSVVGQLPPFNYNTVPNIVVALLAASILSFVSLAEAVVFHTARIVAPGFPKKLNMMMIRVFLGCCESIEQKSKSEPKSHRHSRAFGPDSDPDSSPGYSCSFDAEPDAEPERTATSSAAAAISIDSAPGSGTSANSLVSLVDGRMKLDRVLQTGLTPFEGASLALQLELVEVLKTRQAERAAAAASEAYEKLVHKAWKRLENICNLVFTIVSIGLTYYFFGYLIQL